MIYSKAPQITDTPVDQTLEVLEQAGIGVFRLNLETGESHASSAWKTMLGFASDADIVPQAEWRARVHPDDLPTVVQSDEAMLAGKTERSKTVFRMQHLDGDWIWIQSDMGVAARDANGKPSELSGVHVDVSDRVAQDKAKDEFVAMISHELRTPLTSVIGALKMANSGQIGAVPKTVENVLQLAQRNSNRLLHLVNELLDFKSLESGELSYELSKLNVREVASDATLSMEGYLQDGQTIQQCLPEGDAPILIEADVNRLQQILANLLSNAAKFSPPDAAIELCVEVEDGHAQFNVRDHGPGVPEELQDRMFQRFIQAKTGEKRKFKSTGLGLSICKQMTEGMGGDIGYFNNDEGGATFWARFPLLAD